MAETDKKLSLAFHGRVIDHLGIQMYQSPTAALAELVSNCWDADAEKVEITLPAAMSKDAEIVVKDNGSGMTFEDCQKRFLNVGYDCRGGKAKAISGERNRPVLGRKGIGKFAGFGIAESIRIDTVAKGTGERTVFELDLDKLRGTDYIEGSTDIEVLQYSGPSSEMKALHGTTITLKSLVLKKTQSAEHFARSMSRRFLLAQRVADFRVLVNGQPIPVDADLKSVEFEFPRAYEDAEKPAGLTMDEKGWGIEDLGQGRLIRWRFLFYEDTIKEDELRGIAVFANGKLAQRPFSFNITGGISGQQGLEYLSGKVEADYIDSLSTDLIATERQRINWEHEEAIPLLEWGRKRVDDLCKIWKRRRAAEKLKAMEDKMVPFAGRLGTLQPSERKTVRSALTKLAQVSSLTTKQFEELGEAVLTSWEAGRLKELVHNLADSTDMTADRLIELLMEANVLTALNAYEAIKNKTKHRRRTPAVGRKAGSRKRRPRLHRQESVARFASVGDVQERDLVEEADCGNRRCQGHRAREAVEPQGGPAPGLGRDRTGAGVHAARQEGGSRPHLKVRILRDDDPDAFPGQFGPTVPVVHWISSGEQIGSGPGDSEDDRD
jgi:hypothetical protein